MIDASAAPVIVPVVTPPTADPATSGRVRNLSVSPQAIPAWLERRAGGQYGVKGVFADRGYVLLRTLYEQEGNAEGWAKYQRYLAAWAAGTARISFPFEALPREVQRRQTVLAEDPEFARPSEFRVKPTTGAVATTKPARGAKAAES